MSIQHKALVRRVFRIARRKPREISIAFLSDEKMRRLNKTYRGIDATTDVLSFETGDILISRREAARRGHSIDLLVVHGVLHVLGFDHERATDARRMERLERRILRTL